MTATARSAGPSRSTGHPRQAYRTAQTVAGGWFHFCADGAQTVCWGNNERGQLGMPPRAARKQARDARPRSRPEAHRFLVPARVDERAGQQPLRPFADADQFAPSRLRADWTAQSLLNNGIDVAGLQEQDAGQLAGILNAAQGRLASFPTPDKGDLRAETAIVWNTRGSPWSRRAASRASSSGAR